MNPDNEAQMLSLNEVH